MTPTEVSYLSDLVRTSLFDELAQQVYGSERYKSALARDFGITSATVQNWLRENKAPQWAVLLLWEWSPVTNQSRAIMRTWKGITVDLASITRKLEEMARLTRDVSAQSASDEPQTSGA